MKLISMTNFVLEQNDEQEYLTDFEKIVVRYANFLKQPLRLEMFVPCDEIGEVMNYEEIKQSVIEGTDSWAIWETAKEKVLFEGFEYVKFINDGELLPYHRLTKNDEYFNVRFLDRNIEDLLTEFEYGIELTPTALKQIQP